MRTILLWCTLLLTVGAAQTAKTALVVFLHGLGDSGASMKSLFAGQGAGSRRLSHVKFVFPTAPQQAVTVNGGMRMRAWYDLNSLDASTIVHDRAGYDRATAVIASVIRTWIKEGGDPKRVVIGGFSQGAAVSLYASLLADDPLLSELVGVVALSGYMPDLEPRQTSAGGQPALLLCHGTADSTVAFVHGQNSFKATQKRFSAADAKFKAYPGLAHSVSVEEMEDVLAFMEEMLGDTRAEREL